jgi:hypothetical protein
MKSKPYVASLVFLGLLAGCSSTPDDSWSTSSAEQAVCASGKHECSAWGATCNGGTLETCVVGVDGCRKLLAEPCALGCDAKAGACNTCSALTAPRRSKSPATPTAFYESVVQKGDVAIASYRQRDHQYTYPGRGFSAIDLTNPDALSSLGMSPLPDNQSALSLRLDGDHVVGIVPGTGVRVWDAKDPTKIAPLGLYAPADPAKSLAVEGGVAYVGTDVGVDVVDLSNGAAPKLLGVVATTVPASAIAVAGDKLAVAGGTAVEIVDVADKAAPSLLAKASFSGTLYGYDDQPLAFDGQRVAVAAVRSYGQDLWTVLSTLELTAAGTLEPRGTLGGLDGAHALSLDGTDLLIASAGAVGTIDLSDLAAPRWKKHAFVGESFTEVVRKGTMTYAAGVDGVSAIDLARSTDVTMLPLRGADWLGGATTKGGLAYLARTKSGLVIEDVRDPQHPVVLSATAMDATSIALDGFLAYVGVRDEGLRVYDVRSPWAPELVGQVSAPLVGSVSVDGGRACIFDVSQPAHPTLVVQSDAILKAQGISSAYQPFAMRGAHLYLPRADKLLIVDLSNAAAPVTMGQLALPTYYYGQDSRVAFAGDYAYVVSSCYSAATDLCLDVVDVKDETAPQKLASVSWQFQQRAGLYQTLNASPRISTMHAVGNHVFVTNEWGGVAVIDVSDPSAPKPQGELWTSLPGREHFVVDRFLRVFTEASFPFPQSESYADQVIQLCQ